MTPLAHTSPAHPTTTACLLAVAIAFLGGCAASTTLDRDGARTPSNAISEEDAEATQAGRKWLAATPPGPSMSGFRLLSSNLEALAARIAIVDSAERTIDIQYYIFDGDETGLFLVDRLVAAADRGVRVRILLDDMYAHGAEAGLAWVDAHPGIELRLFNPWTERGGALDRGIEFLVTPRLNHRMHNKLFIGDGTVAVFGGRNIADEYFDLNEDFEFKDLDVLAAGPVAAQGGRLFDAFWNGPDAIPLTGLDPAPELELSLARGRAMLDEHRTQWRATEFARAVNATELVTNWRAGAVPWVYAQGRVLADAPEKTTRAGDSEWSGSLGAQLSELFRSARHEILASSPYFVPRRRGSERLEEIVRSGVAVTILTNSLAANDVPLVHAGYARYRARLLRAGVQLFELRRRSANDPANDDGRAFGSANASLHAKTIVVDRRRVFIGSMNLDPRSVALNTEIGVLIESSELAESVAGSILELTAPSQSYRLALGPFDELLWVGDDADGNEVIFRTDPETSWWDRFSNALLGLLPVEGQI